MMNDCTNGKLPCMKKMERLIAVAACTLTALSAESSTTKSSPFSGSRHMSVVTDDDTGCEYIHSDDGGLYPRKASDGVSHKRCNYVDASSIAICIISLPDGGKVSENLCAGYTHKALPGTSLSEGCSD